MTERVGANVDVTIEHADRDGFVLGGFSTPTLSGTSREAVNEPSTATLGVDAAAMLSGPAEYRVMAKWKAAGHVIAAGWVIKARQVGEQVVVEMSNGPALGEFTFGELAIARIPTSEQVWSVAQMAGFKPGSLHIQGLAAAPETIDTIMPIQGIKAGVDLWMGSVRITSDRDLVAHAARHLPDFPAKKRFLGEGAWAVVRTSGSFLLPTEASSATAIEAAVNRIALGAQYSLAADPAGNVVPYERDGILTDPVVPRLTLVHGESSGRTWIRTLDNPPVVQDVGQQRVAVPPTSGGRNLDAAIAAWRRAVRTKDGVAAAGALFESVEFYVGDLELPRLIPKAKLRAICRVVTRADLDEAQRQRVIDVLGWVNRPPLRARFLAALNFDGVSYTDEEVDVLWRLRRVRNNAVHGAEAAEPAGDDLELARGLVNRMLVFRAHATSSAEGRHR